MTRTPLFLGIDGGQTSTKAILADIDGNVIALGSGSACDHISGPHGEERNRRAIHSAVRSVVANAVVDPVQIVSAGMGLTSAAPEYEADHLFEAMLREVAQPKSLWLGHDVASNLAGASGGQPGVVVIAGGGSIAYGIDAHGHEAKAGGMGYLMGDDGSAWWIGLNAIQAAAASADGRGEQTALLPLVLEQFQIQTIRHIVTMLYGPDFTRKQVAALAPVVVDAASAGDYTARYILATAGELLAGMALAVLNRLHDDDAAVDIYPTGGVFSAGSLLLAPFKARLEGGWPSARVTAARFQPVVGALIRAWQTHGIDVTPELLIRIEATLPEG